MPGGRWARSISSQQAIELAARYGVSINYDQVAQAPFFHYTDEQGNRHEVWFEDARSIQAKFNLVKELGIRGFFYWVLGRDFPQNWLLIQDNFVVSKRVAPQELKLSDTYYPRKLGNGYEFRAPSNMEGAWCF